MSTAFKGIVKVYAIQQNVMVHLTFLVNLFNVSLKKILFKNYLICNFNHFVFWFLEYFWADFFYLQITADSDLKLCIILIALQRVMSH